MDAPKTISRYRLTGELGRGGMGVVYRAEDPQLGRQVAIKVILFPADATDLMRGQLEQRFKREARSAAGIHHPGVVTVHDFGRDGDYLFLVMELVAGRSLADKLKTGWLPERAEAFEIAARVADGLAAAHAAGVVHRDVTPRNILLADDGRPSAGGQVGRVAVTDFGIARSIGEETYELTRPGMLVGSPSFMAPEQVRNREVDERADVFSLGVVLYQLLTGKLPFRSQDLTSLLYQIVHEDPFDPQVRGKLGPATVGFLRKCLAKDAAERVAKAGDFAREARRLKDAARTAELEETVALGAMAPRRAERSRRGARTLLALALVAATAAGAWILVRALDGGHRAATADAGEPPAPPAAHAEPAAPAAIGTGEPRQADAATPLPAVEPAATDVVVSRPVADPPAAAPEPEPAEPETTPPSGRPEPEPPAAEPAGAATAGRESMPLDVTPAPVPPPADTVPPVLDVDMPRELTAAGVVLSGRVMDDGGGPVTLTVDGDIVPVEADGAFVARRPLSPGRNSLAFVAVDAAGNPTMKSVDVTAPGAVPGVSAAKAAAETPATAPPRAAVRPRFADRGDGTVADTLTGITWAKRVERSDGWKASKSYCRKLELGRQRDWMLPTIEELEELHRSGVGVLAFPSGMIWSDTRNGSAEAWAFDFTAGRRVGQPVGGGEGIDFKAFCLRRQRRPDDRRRPGQDLEPPPFGPIGTGTAGGGPPAPRGGGQPPLRGGAGGGGGRGGGGGGGGGGG